jgi:hypothetical protein
MHLTNYAINKNSEKFSENEDQYKKRLVDIYEVNLFILIILE